MIEKVRIFSKKPLNGLIKIEDEFQIYSEDMEINEELPISEREYSLILEIHVDPEVLNILKIIEVFINFADELNLRKW